MSTTTSYSTEQTGSMTPLARTAPSGEAIAPVVAAPAAATPAVAAPAEVMPAGTALAAASRAAHARPTKRTSGTWLFSLTGICFLFGVLLAMQLRAQQRVQQLREIDPGAVVAQQEIGALKRRSEQKEKVRLALQDKVNTLQRQLASATTGSDQRAKQLSAQMKDLQLLAGMTPVSGPGIVVTLSDNPDAAKQGGGPFLPGIVHDFDLLQVVNELRASGAEAIAVNGRRITSFTPIRCVGPVIYVNNEHAAAPFRVEAIGDPSVLQPALRMPDGIVDKLSSLFPVRTETAKSLHLPAAERPRLRVIKVG
jgi:uncharacterized protein YlxW (UPF0749 family)